MTPSLRFLLPTATVEKFRMQLNKHERMNGRRLIRQLGQNQTPRVFRYIAEVTK